MGNEHLIEAAFDYVQRGLSVIALTDKMPNGKVHKRGLYDALTYATLANVKTAGEFLRVFGHPGTTGIGILTGPVYYVVDIDGEEGAAQWKAIAGGAFMPDRWVARTGRGLHLWYGSTEQWPTTKLGPKLDFKGIGGYVAAPPSRHPDGHLYEWLLPPANLEPPMEMPDPLHDLLVENKRLREAAMVGKSMRAPVPMDQRVPGLIYRDASFEGVLAAVREMKEGNRNNVLYWAAATMRDDGASPDDMAQLLDVAVEAGLPRWEARRTIQSAMSAARD